MLVRSNISDIEIDAAIINFFKCGNEPQCFHVPLEETLLVKKGKQQGVQHFNVWLYVCVCMCVCIDIHRLEADDSEIAERTGCVFAAVEVVVEEPIGQHWDD